MRTAEMPPLSQSPSLLPSCSCEAAAYSCFPPRGEYGVYLNPPLSSFKTLKFLVFYVTVEEPAASQTGLWLLTSGSKRTFVLLSLFNRLSL